MFAVFCKHGLPLTRDKTVLPGPFIPGDAYDASGSVCLLTEVKIVGSG